MARPLGRYELLRPLARGGMAEVFLARRRAAGVEKWLVVKRMRPERSGDVRFLDLFVREARLSMSLAHQNIVPVFDFGRIDDQVFLAMERVEGRDLGSSLARAGVGRALPPLIAAFVAAECCQALDYAHHRRGPDGVALGIVHRDVTPRNVLLSWSGEVKLTDFGIAALANESTARVLGTPAYMAPEQARGDAIDARADVYSVGLVLREALTGERGRAGDDRETIMAAARRGELGAWPPAAGGVEIPPALAAIVTRATALAPAERYADARSMLEALDGYIVGERAANRGEAPPRQLAAWLAKVWDGEQGDGPAEGDGDGVDAQHLLSFLDDGALGVIGTGTERSMAATIDAAPEVAAVADGADGAELSTAPIAPVVVVQVAAATPSKRSTPLARTTWVVALGLGGAAYFGYKVTRRDGDERGAVTMNVADAGMRHVIPSTSTSTDPSPSPSPSTSTSPKPNPIPDPSPKAKPNPNPNPNPKAKPNPNPNPATTPAIHRNVTINARPWANFTVDDDPAPHQTVETLSLTAGPHHIHFSNPPLHIERDVTIDVPADHDLKFVEPLQ